MECEQKYYCRCCYHAGELKMLSGIALDVYTMICHPQGLKDDAFKTFACFRCHKFLEEVHCFRNEHRGNESGNLDFKSHEVDIILRHVIDENSAKIGIKTEIIDEDVEMDQMDIQINKIEVYVDPENSQQMSDTSRESLFVSNVEQSEIEVHNSLNTYDNRLLIESRINPCIENNKSICRPPERLGKVHEENRDRPFKCNECSHTTTTTKNLEHHIRRKHCEEGSFFCDHCDYYCQMKHSLYNHMQKHFPQGDKPYKCNECSYETTASSRLKSHILHKHSDERPFSCNMCDSCFKTKSNLSYHIKKHFPNPYTSIKCNECSYIATTSGNLKRHALHKHSEERPFSCDLCNSRFKSKSNLAYHWKKHFPKRDKFFPCDKCSYEATTSYNLKRHILNEHSDVRPFPCDQCEYRFKTKSTLSKHMKTHFPKREKTFQCNHCSYEAMTSGNLKGHILYKHSEERPFSCDQCDSRFKTKSDLSKHLMTHLTKRNKSLNPIITHMKG